MQKFLFNLAAFGVIVYGGGFLFIELFPQYEKYLSINLYGQKPTEFDKELEKLSENYKRWPEDIYPYDFKIFPLDNNIAYRWVPSSETLEPCKAKHCKSLEVISRYSCPNNLYAKVIFEDENSRNIGYTNDSTSPVFRNEKVLFKFRSWEEDLKYWSLRELNCY